MSSSSPKVRTLTRAFQQAVVIGDGGWGTALALILVRNGLVVRMWCHDPQQAQTLTRERENKRYLPGVALPEGISFHADPHEACTGADLAVSVVPTQFLRGVAGLFEEALSGQVPIVSATKGLEIESFLTPTAILRQCIGERAMCVLTGPTHAEEVARGLPASVIAASRDEELARRVQAAFGCDSLRVYTHGDPRGAELAGALKNVIAIAAGICDGLGLGDNAKAALIARGMVEMARFGSTRGAQATTFFGLAGMGDLMTTCYSRHSRNRSVGERIGRGETLQQVLSGMQMVAEGVWTTKALFGPESEDSSVSMPIAQAVHAILFEDLPPRAAVLRLMQREPAVEMKGLELT
jgi:glycerol-3-phosphate dehydrogenase (NAD(P)+)